MLKGDTIRLDVAFYDWDGNTLVDPDEVTLTIYNISKRVLETIHNASLTKLETGKYRYFYTASVAGKLFYEWKGMFGELPNLILKSLQVNDRV